MREGTRIVLDLKRDGVANVIVNQLYKFTELQTSYGINNVAITKGRPKTMNLKDLIVEFVDFRMDVIKRRTQFELRKAQERAHILQGYLIALDHLDEVISLIRNSVSPEEAKKNLIDASKSWTAVSENVLQITGQVATVGFTEVQAKAILELRLQRLTGMERDKIKEEFEGLMQLINKLQELLASEALRYELIKTELLEVKEKFGDARKTEISYRSNEMRIEDLIEDEDVVITISHLGYIKRTSADDYRQQKRGGRGAIGSKTREEDYVEHLFVASTHHTLMFFTEMGRCYWLKVYEIPEGDKNTKGRAIQNIMQLPQEDKVRAIIDIKNFEDKDYVNSHYILLCTKKGVIKKTTLEDFSRPRANGVNAINIIEGDQLIEAKLTDGNCDVMMALKSGRAIRFPETKVRPTGRGAIGVGGIEVDSTTDEVIGMVCVNREDVEKTILVVSEKGFGKRTPIDEYRITNRGGKGVKTINVTDKTGSLVGILDVSGKEDLVITCRSGITIRTSISDIREAGRATQGVKLIRLDDTDEIAAISKIEEDEKIEVPEGEEQTGESFIVTDELTVEDLPANAEGSKEEGTDTTNENNLEPE
jgi:DNA gyrase subunit A